VDRHARDARSRRKPATQSKKVFSRPFSEPCLIMKPGSRNLCPVLSSIFV
jgi:hypothetical protein